MNTYSREELMELAAAYALGATTPEETAAIEAALPTSPELAAEVASFREVAAEMARLAPVQPSPLVRSRLLSRIQREPHAGASNGSLATPPKRCIVHLKAADTVNGPGIQFFWNEKHHSGVAHAFRLPPVPANRAYQLWVIVDGRPSSVKVFNSDPDGRALVEGLTVPASSRGVIAIALTVEPSGGSEAPTSVPILQGSVSASY